MSENCVVVLFVQKGYRERILSSSWSFASTSNDKRIAWFSDYNYIVTTIITQRPRVKIAGVPFLRDVLPSLHLFHT